MWLHDGMYIDRRREYSLRNGVPVGILHRPGYMADGLVTIIASNSYILFLRSYQGGVTLGAWARRAVTHALYRGMSSEEIKSVGRRSLATRFDSI